MSDQSAEQPRTVRLFPDYADTVLWFGGPIGYELTGLTPGLISDLRDWEQSYYDSLTPDLDWISADLARQFSRAGNRLGQRVADELGDGYSLEFTTYEENVPTRRFRAVGPAANAPAVAAFEALASARRTEEDENCSIQEPTSNAEDSAWFAYAPLSKTVFRPPSTDPD